MRARDSGNPSGERYRSAHWMGVDFVVVTAERRFRRADGYLVQPGSPNMKFLTASSGRNLEVSGPTWGASGDPYLVGSLFTSGTRERRRASGGIT
jgi:hypothetical protein